MQQSVIKVLFPFPEKVIPPFVWYVVLSKGNAQPRTSVARGISATNDEILSMERFPLRKWDFRLPSREKCNKKNTNAIEVTQI